MSLLRNYYVRLLIFSIAVFMLCFVLAGQPSRFLQTDHVYVITLFFAVTTMLANMALTRGDARSREFVMKIMGVSAGRLLFCMITIFVYSRVHKAQALGFACQFMIQYILFTIFELTHVLKHLREPRS